MSSSEVGDHYICRQTACSRLVAQSKYNMGMKQALHFIYLLHTWSKLHKRPNMISAIKEIANFII